MAISILFQIIIIWYCEKAWCVKCVPWWRIICHNMILFRFPSPGYVKTLLEFPIHQHNSSTKSNKKPSFHAVSYSSLLEMICSLLISCICKLFFSCKKRLVVWCKLFFACKKIYNFSSISLEIIKFDSSF